MSEFIGKKMDSAKISYAEAMNKLSSGRGNIVSRTEELKKLGAKSTKNISEKLIERAELNLLEQPEEQHGGDVSITNQQLQLSRCDVTSSSVRRLPGKIHG